MAQLRSGARHHRHQAEVFDADHRVEFYERDADLVESVSSFLRPALAGGCAIVVATGDHLQSFAEALGLPAAYSEGGSSCGRMVLLEASDTLDRLLVDGSPDPSAFDETLGRLVRSAVVAGGPVRLYGEMVATLWQQGRVQAAMDLEDLWNQLGQQEPFGLLCGYPSALFSHPATLRRFAAVCCQHTEVLVSARQELAGWASNEQGGRRPQVRGVRWQLPAALSSGGHARRHLQHLLKAWGLVDLLDVAQLLTTELVNNAVLHARSDVGLRVTHHSDGLRVEVTDAGRGRLQRVHARPHDTSGRGVMLVETLSSAWGTVVEGGRKTVWFELRPSASV